MNELLTKHYLPLALVVALSAAALWALVVLFGFTSLEAGSADTTAAALGLVICFLVTFLVAVLASGVYDVWRGTKAEEALETALWAAPVQRERIGFVLMAGSLLLLVNAATGAIAQPLWPALSGILLFGGGLVLVGTALQDEVGPDRPFHRHLQKKEAKRREAQRRKAEAKQAEEQADEEHTGTEQEAEADEPASSSAGSGDAGEEEPARQRAEDETA